MTDPSDDDLLAFADVPPDALQCPLCAAVSDAADGECSGCGFPLSPDLR